MKYIITALRGDEELQTSKAKDLKEAKQYAKAILKDEGATEAFIWFAKNYPQNDYIMKFEAV